MNAEVLIAFVCLVAQVAAGPGPKDTNSESVEVRYARAQLQLAVANLNRVEQANKRVERSVPGSVVAEYQHDVEVARMRLEQATGLVTSEFQVWLRRAEAEQKGAETTWKKAVAANQSVPGTFEPLDIERFRLRAEVARLQLERGQSLVQGGREAQLRWQIDLLDNQVQRLKEETRQSTPFVGIYPPWPW